MTEYYCPNNTKIEYFPYTEEGNRYPSRERFVRFDDLTTDIGNQRVYWYDYKGEKARLLENAGKVAWERDEHELREQYVDFWIRFHNGECKGPEGEYRQIRNKLSIHDILIPER